MTWKQDREANIWRLEQFTPSWKRQRQIISKFKPPKFVSQTPIEPARVQEKQLNRLCTCTILLVSSISPFLYLSIHSFLCLHCTSLFDYLHPSLFLSITQLSCSAVIVLPSVTLSTHHSLTITQLSCSSSHSVSLHLALSLSLSLTPSLTYPISYIN